MRLLLDSCVWAPAARELREAGHDVARVVDWPADPGDIEVLAAALEEKRVLVTLDKDFGELAVVRGKPHAGILRLVGFSARDQDKASSLALDRYRDELLGNAIGTVTPRRTRVRMPE